MATPTNIDFAPPRRLSKAEIDRRVWDALFERYGYTVACQLAWDIACDVFERQRKGQTV